MQVIIRNLVEIAVWFIIKKSLFVHGLVICISWWFWVEGMMGMHVCDFLSKVCSFFVSLSWFSVHYGENFMWVLGIFQWVDIRN